MNISAAQYSPVITVMMKAARIATRRLARDFGEVENLQVSRKGTNDFVSSADTKAEQLLIKELQRARPDYSILSEEAGEIKGSDPEYRWIIDPLDGTINFLHGLPNFCVTIALEKKLHNGKSEIVAAVTESPILKETFWAEKNNGAWLESADRAGMQRLRVGARRRLSDSLLCIGSFKTDMKAIGSVPLEVSAVRCLGSTALGLAYTAAGRFDAFIHNNAEIWDMAAGMLILKEAGGSIADIKDKDKMFESKSIVAANEELHRVLYKSFA